jgi:hypothetical protein
MRVGDLDRDQLERVARLLSRRFVMEPGDRLWLFEYLEEDPALAPYLDALEAIADEMGFDDEGCAHDALYAWFRRVGSAVAASGSPSSAWQRRERGSARRRPAHVGRPSAQLQPEIFAASRTPP